MVSRSSVVFALAALCAFAAATEVQQCPGRSIAGLSSDVQLTPCKKPPCRLKKGRDQHIRISFTPENDIPELKNHVTAELIGIPLPFPGVDGSSIRDKVFSESGDPASWPLKAGIKYTYKDSFPIHSIYPTTQVLVHWALKDAGRDIVCFEVLARIQ